MINNAREPRKDQQFSDSSNGKTAIRCTDLEKHTRPDHPKNIPELHVESHP